MERRRNYLVWETNYCTEKFLTENLLDMKIRKTQMLINNPVYLGLSILDLNKTVIYEFFYDYLKPKIWWKLKTLLCEYRQFPPLHKSRRYLERYCRRCWNKTWYFQLWTGPLPKEKN